MDEQNRNRDIFKYVQWIRLIGITLAVYVTLEYVLPMVFPFCIGLVVALMLYPLRKWFERRLHAKRELAGFLALFTGICVTLLVVLGLCYLLFCCGSYAGKCGLPDRMLSQGRIVWDTCCNRLYDMTGRWVMEPEDYTVLIHTMQARSFRFDPGMLAANWKNLSGQTIRTIACVLVSIVSALLMLNEFEELRRRLGHIAGRMFHRGFGQTLRQVGWGYVKAQAIIMATITCLCVLGLLVARERYWLVVGIAIGICDALPFLGTGICFLPWALWRLLNGRYVTAVWFVALYFITSFTRQTLEPKLIGKKIGVPPLAVLISIYVGIKVYSGGGFLLGPISAFLIWQLYSDHVEKEDAYANDAGADRVDDPV